MVANTQSLRPKVGEKIQFFSEYGNDAYQNE